MNLLIRAGTFNLRHCDLKNCSLQRVNFSGADLTCADLSQARLVGCDFRDSKLDGCNFSDTRLSLTVLPDMTNLSKASAVFVTVSLTNNGESNNNDVKTNNTLAVVTQDAKICLWNLDLNT
jgi:2-iminobutanoate/2-iminopropanoate deaminase